MHKLILGFMSDLAVFVETLRAIPDGAGNLLDNLAVLATSDVAEGQSHVLTRFPMLVVGKAGGALRSGVHYRSETAENALRIPLMLARAVGAPLATFGVGPFQTADGVTSLQGA